MLLDLLFKVAPDLLGAAFKSGKTKDLVEVSAKVAREAFGSDNPQAIEAAINSPVQLEAFKARLTEESAQLQAQIADIQDARRQTVELAQAGSAMAWAPAVLTGLVTVGFIGLTYALLFKQVPDSNVAMVLFGALSAEFTRAMSYWLGSSAGSKRSGDAVRAIAEAKASK